MRTSFFLSVMRMAPDSGMPSSTLSPTIFLCPCPNRAMSQSKLEATSSMRFAAAPAFREAMVPWLAMIFTTVEAPLRRNVHRSRESYPRFFTPRATHRAPWMSFESLRRSFSS